MTTKYVNGVDQRVKEYINTLTLLCVEDDDVIQFMYKTIFENSVKKTILCSDGQEGYDAFINNEVDIIITDYLMPNLDGLGMIEKIRELNSTIPIILVSSIEDIKVIKQAIDLNINNFMQKPIKKAELINVLTTASKILIADNYIQEQREKKLTELKNKNKYNSYQEDLAFAKELNILKNDFYYQMIDTKYLAMLDFMYQPLDVLSGDAYSARKVSDKKIFFLVVDGMGKGISASLSAMLITSFINHLIDTIEFDLKKIITASLEYIKPILLEEEILCVDYILLDNHKDQLSYAKFSMPPSLTQTQENKVVKIKSNNPPISKYMKDFSISNFDTSDSIKFLFYSDGMVENTTRFKDKTYSDFIQNDFLNSFTKEGMREKLLWKIKTQEDDITFIFLNKLYLQDNIVATKIFKSTLEELESANEWYNEVWKNFSDDTGLIYNASVVFSELFMNAYEHGSLGLNTKKKHKLLEEDTYFTNLKEMELTCDKKITVRVSKIKYIDSTYIVTAISDEGDGFDTNILSVIFRNKLRFNGRGVFVSRRSSLGIYYNNVGNSVLFLHKL